MPNNIEDAMYAAMFARWEDEERFNRLSKEEQEIELAKRREEREKEKAMLRRLNRGGRRVFDFTPSILSTSKARGAQ